MLDPDVPPQSHQNKIVRVASKQQHEEADTLMMWIAGGVGALLVAGCIGITGWDLTSVMNLKIDFAAAEARSAANHDNNTHRLDDMKTDEEKRFADFKNEEDRRFAEIQKQLESMNFKLDKLMKYSPP